MNTAYGSHVTDEYVTASRAALDVALLARRLHERGFVGELPHYAPVMTSTQDAARELLGICKRPPYSVVTDEQSAGRGRLTRQWEAPTGAAVLLTQALPASATTVAAPLAIGVSVARVVRSFVPMLGLKWPNDLVIAVDGELRKLGGLIVEVHDDVLLAGIGINLAFADDELPTAQAISLSQLGVVVEREGLVASLVTTFANWIPPTVDDYRQLCMTLGEDVRVMLTDGSSFSGVARDVTDVGALSIDVGGQRMDIAAGDVEHIRSHD